MSSRFWSRLGNSVIPEILLMVLLLAALVALAIAHRKIDRLRFELDAHSEVGNRQFRLQWRSIRPGEDWHVYRGKLQDAFDRWAAELTAGQVAK